MIKSKALTRPDGWSKSWLWLFIILLVSPLLPEYVAPFTVTIGYLVFLREQKQQHNKIKLGVQGKAQMLCMLYMLLACSWSATALFSAAIAGLFLWMFLAGLMIANLCTDKEKLLCAVKYFVWAGGVLGVLGILQLGARMAEKAFHIPQFIPDPFYRLLDTAIFRILPFSVKDRFFDDRSSGTFTNPNIYVTILVITLPFALYLLMRAKERKQRWLYLGIVLAMAGGVAASKSRIALAALLLAFVLSIFCFGRKKARIPLLLMAAAVLVAVPMILSRFPHAVEQIEELSFTELLTTLIGGKSSRTHIAIWEGCIDYLANHPKAFWIGLGGGTENSWNIILELYKIDQPHAHNLILEFWMEYGLFGVLLFLAPLAIMVYHLAKIIRNRHYEKWLRMLAYSAISALLCYLLTGMTDFLFNSPKQVILLFILLGFAEAIHRYANKQKLPAHALAEIKKEPVSMIK